MKLEQWIEEGGHWIMSRYGLTLEKDGLMLNDLFNEWYVSHVGDARQDWYDEGYQHGELEGYSSGYAFGQSDGYEEGYEEGLTVGKTTAGL